LRARRDDQHAGDAGRGHAARRRREHHLDLLWTLLVSRRRLRPAAGDAGGAPLRSARPPVMRNRVFWAILIAVGLAFVVVSRLTIANDYFYFAGYVVLQYIVL